MKTHPTLQRVNADKFFPCQKIAARSRNGAMDALEARDTGAIVYRYLNNRYQQRAFRRNALIGALVPLMGWPYSGVNTHNAIRCRNSKRACKEVLQNALAQQVFARIRKERHAHGDYLGLLQKYGIDITEAKRLRATHGRKPHETQAQSWS